MMKFTNRLIFLWLLFALATFGCSVSGADDDDDDIVSCPPEGCVAPDDDDDIDPPIDDDDDDDDTQPQPGDPVCGDGKIEEDEVCETDSTEACIDSDGYSGQRVCATDCLSFDLCVSEAYCGDEIVNGPEVCDDGPGEGEGLCADDCAAEQACGNGILEGTETCEAIDEIEGFPSDAFHLDPCCIDCIAIAEEESPCDAIPDNCNVGVCLEGRCAYEECPQPAGECGLAVCDLETDRCVLGDPNAGLTCAQKHLCSQTACKPNVNDSTKGICGRGEPFENGLVCDDSDPLTGKTACLNGLCVPIDCGDGVVAPGETCEPGQPEFCYNEGGYLGFNRCNPDCQGWGGCVATEYCGDKEINGFEVCELEEIVDCGGPGQPGKSVCQPDCSGMGDCVLQVFCGNGLLEPPEVCEKGTSDACLDSRGYEGVRHCRDNCAGYLACLSDGFCGDSTRNGPEECDAGGPTLNCSADCKALDLRCGNGRIDPELFEVCDEGTLNGAGPGYCATDCSGVLPLSPDPVGATYALANFLADGIIIEPPNAQPFLDIFVNQGLVPSILFTFGNYIRQDKTLDAYGSFGQSVFGQVVGQDLGKPSFEIDPGDYSAPPAFQLTFKGRRTFRFGLYRIDLVDLSIAGAFDSGGWTMNIYFFEGFIDTEDIKQALGMDLCLFFMCTPERLLFVRIDGLRADRVDFPVQFIYP